MPTANLNPGAMTRGSEHRIRLHRKAIFLELQARWKSC